ncbi:hypothetical protein CAP35_01225 [Chitinophagaceae bacterium IBVUCB1]|nr:hypothetical protein CAP35_01225 [Chitinophagaceae bacterium IBVUCB1]
MDTLITEEKTTGKKDNTVLYIVYAAAAYFGLQYLLQPKRVTAAMVVQTPVKETVAVDDTTNAPDVQAAHTAAQVPVHTGYVNESFPLRTGMRGQRIKAVQQKLGIQADGIFGKGTEAALVRQYRISTVSEIQYRHIMQPGQKLAVAPVSRTDTTTVLKKGSKGTDVYRLQRWLGFKDKRVARKGEPVADSDFGTQTETALLKKTGRGWISIASLNQYLHQARTRG